MSKKKKVISVLRTRIIYLKIFIVLMILPSMVAVFLLFFNGKIYPGVRVDGVLVGGLSPDLAAERLRNVVSLPEKIQVQVIGLDGGVENYDISTSEIGLDYQHEQSSFSAFAAGRSGKIIDDLMALFEAATGGVDVGLQYSIDHDSLNENVNLIASVLGSRPEYPRVEFVDGEPSVFPGTEGVELDSTTLYKLVIGHITSGKLNMPIMVQVKKVDPRLTSEEIIAASERANVMAERSLTVIFEDREFELKDSELLATLNPTGGYREEALVAFSTLVARALDRPPQNPVFVFDSGKVTEFEPALNGLEVEVDKLVGSLYFKLSELEGGDLEQLTLEVAPVETPPAVNISDVNNLGINELIGRGTSKFRGSIASRVHNIAIASERLNGTLIKPGEVFSFNNALGDISVFTGYKQAYIIQGGATVLGDGGGVCQVSTTFFRAALNSGLPIVSRKAHAYRVGYYEQDQPAGLDATIYSPTVDLKVKNDTPGYILIQTNADTKNSTLTIEFYGTSDGRVASVSKPVVYGATPPPEDLYTDDPNLPAGEIKQIDHAAWGAKSQFDYKVVRGDEVLQERTFYSNYQAWQAKFLRGTGPAI
jgi:vancomycin resistance protein YoaR